MKIIAGGLNGNYLRDLLLGGSQSTEWVKAAVAYASGTPELIAFCQENSIPLQFWGRMDPSIPITPNILDKFLKMGVNFRCKLIWKHFHPKVIWFGEYGAYIGSANLTQSAWYKNIECGVFFSQDDLIKNGMVQQLDLIFDGIDKVSVPLTEELLTKIKSIDSLYHGKGSDLAHAEEILNDEFETKVGGKFSPQFDGLSVITKKSASEKHLSRFVEEWNETLQLIRQIADEVSSDLYRPSWVSPDVPKGVQVDQFLHAYFYSFVKTGNASRHEEFYDRNKVNPHLALKEAMKWWSGLDDDPTDEASAMYKKAPYLADILSLAKISKVTEDDFVEICINIFAFWHSSRQTANKTLGLASDVRMEQIDRAKYVARWIWKQSSGNGSNVVDVIKHVLWGGSTDDVVERLWEATYGDEWHIPQFGLSCLGELVGWAMPNKYPPRNGRTSKALKALGNDVKVYGG